MYTRSSHIVKEQVNRMDVGCRTHKSREEKNERRKRAAKENKRERVGEGRER